LAEADLEEPLSLILRGQAAERVLDRFLRTHRAFTSDARQSVAEALFGVGLWRRRLSALLDRDESAAGPRALLYAFLVDLAGLPPPEARALARLGASEGSRLSDRPLSFAEAHSLPDWLALEIQRAAPDDPDALADSLNSPGPICFRANTLKTTRDELSQRLQAEGISTHPCTLSRLGLIAQGRPNILASESHRSGLFEVQDEGSQLVGLWVEARPGEAILDACAGAGGKALLLAAEVGDRGVIHAFDPDRSRLNRLERRADVAGAGCIRLHWSALPPTVRVDRCLVDAPCSELGSLRRGPDLRWRMSPRDFEALPAQQLAICEEALAHLELGGSFVYATCTFRREENEEVTQELERRHPELRRQRPGSGLPDPSLWPHRHGTDGFFAAVYRFGVRR
jgi:16S rRNA (cytosine967-C5)-methyltransferase